MPAFCLALWALAWAVPAQAATKVFNYTGAEQTFTVPGGVSNLQVVVIGGSGGAGGAAGGEAARLSASLNVVPGQLLYVEVGGSGQAGGAGGAGGFNGGAAGGAGAGGGGGASDIRTSPQSAGLAPDHRLIVAAGGGGGGGEGFEPGGAGGSANSSGETSTGGNEGGGPGTASAGGLGGSGCAGIGTNGELGLGGAGGSGESTNSGGGGAGGFYGGGGGGGGCSLGGGGGGGGSSLLPVGGTAELASLATPPQIQITYTPVPPVISIVSPTNGATYVQGQAVTAVYTCTAPIGAGVASCTGPVANGGALDTATVGTHTFTVNAEDTDGITGTKTISYTVVAAPPPPQPPQPPVPNTLLGIHPKKTIKANKPKIKVKFGFSSNVAGASFKCKLDKGSFSSCTSPKGYKVKPGKHKFSVEAVSAGGTDPTPATFSFKVIATH